MAPQPPKMEYLRALTRIESRFATTLVSSRFVNENEKPSEAVFTVTLPQAAFISHFTMCVDGKTIVGEVKEKGKAKVQYERAKERGESAGHIAQAPRETNVFHISANISSGGEATFNLNYQEILQRVHGAYKHVVNIQPQQVVDDIKVDVFIKEACQIKTVKVPKFGSKVGEKTNVELLSGEEEKNVKIEFSDQSTAAHITYCPSSGKQNQIDGQFVVLYDVEKQENGGELQVVNGYFVHFFSPSGLPPAPKHVIFALDKSGSMSGRKIKQTKDAMKKILNDLNEKDIFNILTFNTSVSAWKSESVRATRAAVQKAISVVNAVDPQGGTNIHKVLEDSLVQVFKHGDSNSMKNCMIILLTDGQPNHGERSPEAIVGLTQKLNNNLKVSIQCIGFGADADFDLLKKISMANGGLARRVYADSDADLQLQGVYEEISQLLLTDVKINYLDDKIMPESIIQESSHKLYEGGEFVVVGRMADNIDDDFEVVGEEEINNLTAEINGLGLEGQRMFKCDCISPPTFPKTFKPTYTEPLPPESVGGFVERMWAYLSIKQLLDRAKYASSVTQSKQLKQQALSLSLKYKFVTELTSMVVTQPEKEIECGLEEFGFENQEPSYLYGGPHSKYLGRMMSGNVACDGAVACGPPPVDSYESDGGDMMPMSITGRLQQQSLIIAPGGKTSTESGRKGKRTRTRMRSPPVLQGRSASEKRDDEMEEERDPEILFEEIKKGKTNESKKKDSAKKPIKAAKLTDINETLAQMPLSQVVSQDWKTVLPLLKASTINSLPLATLSAIPWDDVIMFIQPCVFGGLNESVLQSFPSTVWRKVTVEQLKELPVKKFVALSVNTIKYIQKQHWKQIEEKKIDAMPEDARNVVQHAL